MSNKEKQLDFFDDHVWELSESIRKQIEKRKKVSKRGVIAQEERATELFTEQSVKRTSPFQKMFEDTTECIGSPVRISTSLFNAVFEKMEKEKSLKNAILKIDRTDLLKEAKKFGLKVYKAYERQKNGQLLKYQFLPFRLEPYNGMVEVKIGLPFEGKGGDMAALLRTLKKRFALPGIVDNDGIRITIFLEGENMPFLKPLDYRVGNKEYITRKEAKSLGFIKKDGVEPDMPDNGDNE
ncbi:MAG: hypothetical protein M1127_00455 [Patescibacteria group bacterium]|nr:hypothetical protein [Patescibacteria group bacterium]